MAKPRTDEATSDVCFIVRIFNEASVLSGVLTEVKAAVDDVICVDDGSSDSSAQLATAAGATVVRHPRNLGGGAALETGFEFARRVSTANYFVTFDADGQHAVSDALALVQQARDSGVDVMLGSRFLARGSSNIPTGRLLILRTGVLFTRLVSGINVTDTHNGLRVFSRRALERIHLRQHSMAYASELLEQVARYELSYAEWPVSIRYTDYSVAKGQRNLNAVNIAFDVLISKVRAVG